MLTLEEKIKALPPELQQNVEEYLETLLNDYPSSDETKLKQSWAGALSDLRDKYTSVELQHKRVLTDY